MMAPHLECFPPQFAQSMYRMAGFPGVCLLGNATSCQAGNINHDNDYKEVNVQKQI